MEGDREGMVARGEDEGGRSKCQCRHHLKKLREQTKLDEQRYTRAILSANNMFAKGDPDLRQPVFLNLETSFFGKDTGP